MHASYVILKEWTCVRAWCWDLPPRLKSPFVRAQQPRSANPGRRRVFTGSGQLSEDSFLPLGGSKGGSGGGDDRKRLGWHPFGVAAQRPLDGKV